jgi:hypothetical protein
MKPLNGCGSDTPPVAQVPFGGLDRDVAKWGRDLIQIPSSITVQRRRSGAGLELQGSMVGIPVVEHWPKHFSIAKASRSTAGRSENLDQQARVASAVRATSFSRETRPLFLLIQTDGALSSDYGRNADDPFPIQPIRFK